MSSNYAVLGLAMAAAGVLTDVVGARAVWIGAGAMYLVAAAVAVVMTRWLPVATPGGGRSVRGELGVGGRGVRATVISIRRLHPSRRARANGTHTPPLERIAGLLEEIEARREAEAHRTS